MRKASFSQNWPLDLIELRKEICEYVFGHICCYLPWKPWMFWYNVLPFLSHNTSIRRLSDNNNHAHQRIVTQWSSHTVKIAVIYVLWPRYDYFGRMIIGSQNEKISVTIWKEHQTVHKSRLTFSVFDRRGFTGVEGLRLRALFSTFSPGLQGMLDFSPRRSFATIAFPLLRRADSEGSPASAQPFRSRLRVNVITPTHRSQKKNHPLPFPLRHCLHKNHSLPVSNITGMEFGDLGISWEFKMHRLIRFG